MCTWFASLTTEIRPLDQWEINNLREDLWQEWLTINNHIEREPEKLLQEREVLDCLLLVAHQWAYRKAQKWAPEDADKFIKRITAIPQTEQHSVSWYKEKINLLTASEFAYLTDWGSPSQKRNVYEKKFSLLSNPGTSGVSSSSAPVGLCNENMSMQAMLWGHRFESVACRLASRLFFENASFQDGIGRIVHPTLKKLAASPDGLILNGTRKGNLIEIKCPISRPLIEGEIPYEYFCQMQVQMEVLECPTCEYVEMRFNQKREPSATDYAGWWGVLCVVDSVKPTSEDIDMRCYNLRYEYGPFVEGTTDRKQVETWQPILQEDDVVLERTYWYLEDKQWITVHKNNNWWRMVGLPTYENFWVEFDAEYKKWSTSKGFKFVDEE
jgi:hypothetical protein